MDNTKQFTVFNIRKYLQDEGELGEDDLQDILSEFTMCGVYLPSTVTSALRDCAFNKVPTMMKNAVMTRFIFFMMISSLLV